MKLFKKISAIVLATAMFGMSAMAGNVTAPSKIEVASDATQVTVTLNIEEGTTLGAFAASFILYYDTSIFSYNSDLSTCGYGAVDNTPDDDECIMWGTSSNVTVTPDNTTLASFVFDVVEGADPNGAEFTLGEDDWQMYIDEEFSDILPFPENSVITVEVKGNDYPTVTDEAGNTRYVVIEKMETVTATPTSRLQATYLGEIKSSNLYRLLGIDAKANATVDFDSITVKMILPAGDEYPAEGQYDLAIVEG